MLSSRYLTKEKEIEKGSKNPIKIILNGWNGAFDRFGNIYRSSLRWSLKHRAVTLTASLASFIIFMYLGYTLLGSEFIPAQDRAELYVSFKTASGTSLERTAEIAAQMEKIIASNKDIFRYQLLTLGGTYTPVNEGSIYVKLVDKNERKKSVFAISSDFRNQLSVVPGVKTSVALELGHGGGGQAVEYSVRGPDFVKLKALAARVENTVKKAPGAVDVENSEKQARPELRVAIDRQVADDLGLNLAIIGTAVRSLVDGADISRFRDGDEEYDINVRLAPQYRTDVEDINSIYVPSFKKVRGNDFSVPLRQVASIYQSAAPTEVRRYDKQREIRVGSNLAAGYIMSDVMKQVEVNRDALQIPPGYIVAPVGESEIMQESFRNIMFALLLAVIFIYLLLASQFESFLDPFSMGMSLLMAPMGAILALLIFGSPISVMSLIGIVLLMGLVTKNAILLVDFIKQARARGMERTEAILQAGPIRLRPIMMTSLAMIFAMLPLAFAIGPGAEFRAPMAQAVIGGLVSSTLLTLIIVPIVYTLLDDLVTIRSRRREKTRQRAGTGDTSAAVNG